MAIQHDFTVADDIFIGEDKRVIYEIFEADKVTPKNVSGWSLEWTLRGDKGPNLRKTSPSGIAIEGVFDLQANTQRVVVTLQGSDTNARQAGTYRHRLRRTDAGSNAVLSYGNFPLLDS